MALLALFAFSTWPVDVRQVLFPLLNYDFSHVFLIYWTYFFLVCSTKKAFHCLKT